MGLERYIEDTLEKEAPELKRGYDFWFEFGLKTDTENTAKKITDILNNSGEYAQCRVIFTDGLDMWGITFEPLTRRERDSGIYY